MKLKAESEKAGLKLNIQKTKIMATSSITSWQIDGETMEMRESFPRQVDKKSRGPQGERGLEFSRRKKGQTFFSFSRFLRII